MLLTVYMREIHILIKLFTIQSSVDPDPLLCIVTQSRRTLANLFQPLPITFASVIALSDTVPEWVPLSLLTPRSPPADAEGAVQRAVPGRGGEPEGEARESCN